MSNSYLESVDDGLPTRDSGEYAKEKLGILNRFLHMFTVSMRRRPWMALNYIDLEAGPGKNKMRETGEIVLGSPLLALKCPFDRYFLVEKSKGAFDALCARVRSSENFEQIELFNADCNIIVGAVIDKIREADTARRGDQWQSLNLAFIDPEGLEIHWDTVAALGKQTRTDLIINFSTSGITRNIKQMSQTQHGNALDRFFGTRDWRKMYENLGARPDSSVVRRVFIDFYANRLAQLKYFTTNPHGEHIVLNSQNRQLYSLLCASKSKLGTEFFDEAAAKFKQTGLPGFH